MAYVITSECTSCGACGAHCPNSAISAGSNTYVINPDKCTECVGMHREPRCVAICAFDACVADSTRIESEDALIAKAKKLHPDKIFPTPIPSRFRKA
jgi:ferredoxin